MSTVKNFGCLAVCACFVTTIPFLINLQPKTNAHRSPPLATPTLKQEKSICDMTANELQDQQYLRRIWQFWDGGKGNGYMQLCHELMRARSPTVFVDTIDADCIKRVFPDTPKDFDLLIPAHKADYARCRLLTRFGGMYNDYDTIALQSFEPLFDMLDKDHNMVRHRNATSEDVISPVSNIGPMKPNLPGFSSCKDIFHRKMKQRVNEMIGDKLKWPMCESTILRPLTAIAKQVPNAIKFYDLESFDEKTLKGSYIFLGTEAGKQKEIAKYITDHGNFEGTNRFLVVLNNYYNEDFGRLSREEAYCNQDNPISTILRSQMSIAGTETPDCSKITTI